MTRPQLEFLRRTLTTLRRSIDPHQTDGERYEILRSDFDPIWNDLADLLLLWECNTPPQEDVR